MSNYTPLKEKKINQKIIINGIEYTINNNILFDEMGVIVGKLEIDNEITMI